MHQTTIRFGSDLWETLAAAAEAEGMSVAQYLREAAVERLVRSGAADLERPVAATDRLREARAPRRPPHRPSPTVHLDADAQGRAIVHGRIAAGSRSAERNAESSAAVWAQSRLARSRARELRAASSDLRARREALRARRTGQGVESVPAGPDDVARRAAAPRA